MRILTGIDELRAFEGNVFVPTMGALHEGHASLIRRARALADAQGDGRAVVVSIFVNPTQFNDAGDLARYPRTLDADAAVCESAGADAVFAPSVEVVYPPGMVVQTPPLPRQATEPGLEDAHRPGHFAGVCQVVKRLFELVKPHSAVFGEKDWQQLQVIRAMTATQGERGGGVEIVPGPIVREADGLAMSSRNRFLTVDERARAVGVIAALRRASNFTEIPQAEALMAEVLYQHGIEPAYAVVRDAQTLMPVKEPSRDGSYRALVAGKLGRIRLLDNTPWPGGNDG